MLSGCLKEGVDMLQIGIMGVAGVLLAVQFKSGKAEYGIYISIVLSLMIFLSVLPYLETVIEAIRTIGSYIQTDIAFFGTLIKMIGITYIAEFSAGICRDAGYQAIAVQIETFGKLFVLVLGIPVLMALLEAIREFLP